MADPILLDTAPLRDQRSMVDVTGPEGVHRTIEDVEAAWARWADREGLTTRRRRNDWTTDLHKSNKTVVAYISGGKWIGDCPICNGGIACWPFHERGCCLDCGTIYKIDYPSKAEIDQLVELMQPRPERLRNYNRHQGETIADVQRENNVFKWADKQGGGGLVSVDHLRKVLSPREFAKLEKTGLL